jgi:NAD(P)-dependent dehydrogenase (short-subunit alcohol dehydrogenase family)
MFDLHGKVALVTGAMRGMGKSHAIHLAKQGAKVVVTDIDLAECELVVKEIVDADGEAACFAMNVADKADVNKVFDQVVEKFGRVDILVNNAGIFKPFPVFDLSEEEWDKTLAINLKGQFLCVQRAAKEMAKNKWGRIINIASVSSGQVGVGVAGGAHYAASKGGVIGMTETLAIEFGDLGINVNAIAPGSIDTAMSRKHRMPEAEMQHFLDENVPLKRIGQPEEVSAAVVFLASEESSYVNGSTVYVDGGWLAK